jgi:hypothetical protein
MACTGCSAKKGTPPRRFGCRSQSPPQTERALRAFARLHPEEAPGCGTDSRQAVAREFERLVLDGVPVADLPKVEVSDSGTGEGMLADVGMSQEEQK